jgi:hypothetical protein
VGFIPSFIPLIQEGEIISVERAVALHKEKKLSKSLLKKVKKHWNDLDLKGRKGLRAKRRLEKLSQSMAAIPPLGNGNSVSGLVH